MSDLVSLLRTWVHAVHAAPVSDLLDEAADEIERLKSRLRFCDAVIRSGDVAALTDAERSAIKEASEFYIGTRTGVALGGLLERMGGTEPMPKEKRA